MKDKEKKRQYDEVRYNSLRDSPDFHEKKSAQNRKYRQKVSAALGFAKAYPELWNSFCEKNNYNFVDERANNRITAKSSPKKPFWQQAAKLGSFWQFWN